MGTVWADDCDQRAINSKLGQACCQLINCVAPPYYLIQASSVHAGLASIDLLWSNRAGRCQSLRQASVGCSNKPVQIFTAKQHAVQHTTSHLRVTDAGTSMHWRFNLVPARNLLTQSTYKSKTGVSSAKSSSGGQKASVDQTCYHDIFVVGPAGRSTPCLLSQTLGPHAIMGAPHPLPCWLMPLPWLKRICMLITVSHVILSSTECTQM